MAQQLELLDRAGLQVHPEEGRTEPRLWVRRLVVWSEPGVLQREIELRPGLNVVWSPDPADRDTDDNGAHEGLGHTSGKTLFCRLLRYCLGEERFAPEGQRDAIAVAFKEGMVGAEIVVNGTPWAVVRSIGFGRRHVALANGDLEELASSSAVSTGMNPFLGAVESQILSDAIAALVPGERVPRAWLIALAWLARDQECRFHHVLDWRSPASDSGSPARGLTGGQPLDALRALLGGIAPEEYALRGEVTNLSRRRDAAKQDVAHREWEIEHRARRLANALKVPAADLPPGPLVVEAFRQAAAHELARVVRVDPATDVADLADLRAGWEEAKGAAESLNRELVEVEARIPEIERLISRIKGELPGLSFGLHESEHPLCPICEVPIDRTLAEGCMLSHKLPDLEEARERREQRRADLDHEVDRLSAERERKASLVMSVAAARSRADELGGRLHAVERARDSRRDAWYAARRTNDDVERLAAAFRDHATSTATVAKLVAEIEQKREQAAAYREQRARVFQRVAQVFDAVVGELLGPQARGRVTLDGNGLHLAIDRGGDRSSTAFEALKVVAFDLAAMCMSIEGQTHIPAFLVHDSPREADLGLSAYHQLFRLARSLEDVGNQPLFQYIVTTTTRPPKEVNCLPWLRLTLQGTPAEERLLKCDL